MKATGAIRRIDDLGRIVIPKEVRRRMNIREGDPLEIFVNDEDCVIFRKYSEMGNQRQRISQLFDAITAGFDKKVKILLIDTCGVIIAAYNTPRCPVGECVDVDAMMTIKSEDHKEKVLCACSPREFWYSKTSVIGTCTNTYDERFGILFIDFVCDITDEEKAVLNIKLEVLSAALSQMCKEV